MSLPQKRPRSPELEVSEQPKLQRPRGAEYYDPHPNQVSKPSPLDAFFRCRGPTTECSSINRESELLANPILHSAWIRLLNEANLSLSRLHLPSVHAIAALLNEALDAGIVPPSLMNSPFLEAYTEWASNVGVSVPSRVISDWIAHLKQTIPGLNHPGFLHSFLRLPSLSLLLLCLRLDPPPLPSSHSSLLDEPNGPSRLQSGLADLSSTYHDYRQADLGPTLASMTSAIPTPSTQASTSIRQPQHQPYLSVRTSLERFGARSILFDWNLLTVSILNVSCKVVHICAVIEHLQAMSTATAVTLVDPFCRGSATLHRHVASSRLLELTSGSLLVIDHPTVYVSNPTGRHIIVTSNNLRSVIPSTTNLDPCPPGHSDRSTSSTRSSSTLSASLATTSYSPPSSIHHPAHSGSVSTCSSSASLSSGSSSSNSTSSPPPFPPSLPLSSTSFRSPSSGNPHQLGIGSSDSKQPTSSPIPWHIGSSMNTSASSSGTTFPSPLTPLIHPSSSSNAVSSHPSSSTRVTMTESRLIDTANALGGGLPTYAHAPRHIPRTQQPQLSGPSMSEFSASFNTYSALTTTSTSNYLPKGGFRAPRPLQILESTPNEPTLTTPTPQTPAHFNTSPRASTEDAGAHVHSFTSPNNTRTSSHASMTHQHLKPFVSHPFIKSPSPSPPPLPLLPPAPNQQSHSVSSISSPNIPSPLGSNVNRTQRMPKEGLYSQTPQTPGIIPNKVAHTDSINQTPHVTTSVSEAAALAAMFEDD